MCTGASCKLSLCCVQPLEVGEHGGTPRNWPKPQTMLVRPKVLTAFPSAANTSLMERMSSVSCTRCRCAQAMTANDTSPHALVDDTGQLQFMVCVCREGEDVVIVPLMEQARSRRSAAEM